MGAKNLINVTFFLANQIKHRLIIVVVLKYKKVYFVQAKSPYPPPPPLFKNPAELEAFIVLMERRNCIFTVPALLDSVANEY